jgi:lipoprotein-anchoring transpeptidase ErfK/SrfK
VTDLATKPNADEAPSGDLTDTVTTPETGAGDAGHGTSEYAWAPTEPAPKKRHLGLWIGIPAGVAVVGLVASSLVLIAPGTAVAGVPIGGMTPGAAAEAVQQRLDATTIVLTGAAGDVEVSGAALGATVDAQALVETAFAEHPMWNPTAWFAAPIDAEVSVDPEKATAALRDLAPSLYTDPVGAVVAFDPATAGYTATAAVPGEGIDLAQVETALHDAFAAGQGSIDIDPAIVPVDSTVTTEAAQAAAAKLNGILDTVGFYVGEERTVPVDRAVAASWLTVGADAAGTFEITAKASAIQPTIDGLAAAVDRPVVNSTVITDTEGNVLSDETPGVVGRALGSTDGMANAFAKQLSDGNGVFPLTVSEVPFTTTALARHIEVNLSEQRTYLYENGALVQSYAISSGLAPNYTPTGNFRIGWKTSMQNMGNRDLTQAPNYFTPDVPWVSYFNGDVAFHGTYWHNNFGSPMSHGCINMTIAAAKYVYDWAPKGVEVSVYY